MLEEHERGRAMIRAMRQGDAAARAAVARGYAAMLRDHIDKEDGVLFALADAVLDEAAQRLLARDFAAVEAEQGRTAALGWAEETLARLAAALG
jgi:hemerythrin-like domain-containing protein